MTNTPDMFKIAPTRAIRDMLIVALLGFMFGGFMGFDIARQVYTSDWGEVGEESEVRDER